MALSSAVLEIDSSNVLHNIRYFRSFLQENTKLMVLVKANAYGLGASGFTKIIEQENIDYLGVAFPEKGILLREEGCKLPIVVLSATPLMYPLLIRHQLEPSIPTLENLRIFEAAARQEGRQAVCHIKLDTGMHRLGFDTKQLPALVQYLEDRDPNRSAFKIASIFSHLAVSDDPAEDVFTRSQIALFRQNSEKILKVLPYRPLLHILNSAGIERFGGEAAFDMVRLGIGIYGISAMDMTKVRPTARLKAPVLQVKQISMGDTVGYGRYGTAPYGPKSIATLAIGYADGIDRRLGRGHASFSVHGHRAPTIGNICMDMCMIDVTGLDVKAGDSVTVFGDDPDIVELAKILDTIPYEILTSISPRIPRRVI